MTSKIGHSIVLVFIEIILTSLLLHYDCTPTGQTSRTVFPVENCPGNLSEVEDASKRLNCSGIDKFENTYHCLPLSDLSQLVELCYQTSYLVEKGNCMVLQSGFLNNRSCLHFTEGCPGSYYDSKLMLNFPACTEISKEKRCYLAEPTCTIISSDLDATTVSTTINVTLSKVTPTSPAEKSGGIEWIAIPVIISALVSILLCSCFIWQRKRHHKANKHDTGEAGALLLESYHQEFVNEQLNNGETTLNEQILKAWQENNSKYVPTRASKFVEERIKSQNLLTVVGNSGCGKSAIIQHIALKFKEELGWNIKVIDEVKEIKEICSPGISPDIQTLFVLNDPIGKETLDERSYHSWKTYQTTLATCLTKVKLLVSCRRCVIYDKRVEGILKKESNIVEIDSDSDKWRLSEEEKKKIFNKYCQHMDISEEDVNEIIKTEAYFPLLCKLFSNEPNYKEKGIKFFQNPISFIKQDIEHFKNSDKKKNYCALILIVVFNNNLNLNTIGSNNSSLQKYKNMLGICELPENTHISVIRNTLLEMKGSYVKCVGHVFQFLHDFIMEITTLAFGVDCPQETIQYADSGFLRRRMKIEDDIEEEDRDPFTVYLPKEYIGDLVDRFIIDIQSEHFIDVLLNPCFRNENVTENFKEKMKSPENLPTLSLSIKWEIDRSEFSKAMQGFGLSRLGFLDCKDEICPMIGFVIFCHNDISSFFLNRILQTTYCTSEEFPIFSAVCASGDLNLLNHLSQEDKKTAMMEIWDDFLPIHIASVFHNFLIIEELIKLGADVNMFTIDGEWTPLLLAAANDEEHLKEAGRETEGGERRNKTILCLLRNGANINLCSNNGDSPLSIACQNGHDSSVQLLLNKNADINLCDNHGVSPLFVACQNGHDSMVQLLLNNGADIKLCNNNGVSPLYVACQDGHDRTVQLLLNNGVDINSCCNDGASPLYIACQNRYESTVQLLLNNGADIISCHNDGFIPLHIACQNGHDSMVQLLLNNGADISFCGNDGNCPLYLACRNRNDSTVQLLLNNGADVNIRANDGESPLFIACENGHESTAQLLLHNGAVINSCNSNGVSSLYLACQNGHDSTVQLLLDNGADINLRSNEGISPLYIACEYGHDNTVQLLLHSGADMNTCDNDGVSPLYIACQYGHDSTIQLLLNNCNDVNSCNKNGVSPFHVACYNGNNSTVQLLLNNGADINIGANNGNSPLYSACQNGNDSTVQLLLHNGADINLCNKYGASPLYIACKNKHDSTIQFLLNKNADINLCDNDGISPLFVACQNGHDSMVQLLLNNGANINSCQNDGVSPLYIACQNGHDNTVQLLLNNGADINLCKNDGNSPLHVACYNRHDSTVQLLLNNGSDINLCNKFGVRPLSMAFYKGNDSTVQLLLHNGANTMYEINCIDLIN